MWQHIGDDGRCNGVAGACDRNHSYKDYPAIIGAVGLNGLVPETGIPVTDYKSLYDSEKSAHEALKAGIAALIKSINNKKPEEFMLSGLLSYLKRKQKTISTIQVS